MGKFGWAPAGIVVAATLAACSSAGNVAPLAPEATVAANAHAGVASKLVLRIRVPRAKIARRVGSHYISAATKGLTMAFTGAKTFTQTIDLTPADPRCKGTPLVCTIAIGLVAGSYTATIDAYDQAPVGGAIPVGAKLLSTAAGIAVTVKRGTANNLSLTLDGVPASIVFASVPPASTGDGFLFEKLSVTVADADGYTIVGTYETPVTLTDSDTSGATAITTSGSDNPPAGTLLSSSDAAALSYSGAAIVPVTLTATAGAVHDSTTFDVFLPIYVGDTGNNAIKQIPPECSSTHCVQTLGNTFSGPQGVAVDTSGNVYVADYTGNTVEKLTPNCFSNACVIAIGGGFNAPFTVAVDAAGNVFVADYGNNKVKKIPPQCFLSSCVVTLGGGFNGATGVAVDASDNVYVADTFDNSIQRMPATCTSVACVTTLPNGSFSMPTDVAVDGAGDVFVLETFSSNVLEIPAGCATASCVALRGGGFNGPYGIASDWFGDVFVADTGNNVTKIIPPGCTASACVTTFGTGFHGPYGIAILDTK